LEERMVWCTLPTWTDASKRHTSLSLPKQPILPSFLLAEAWTLKILFHVRFQENRENLQYLTVFPHVVCNFTRYKTVHAKSP
jgi:hypothetical protein